MNLLCKGNKVSVKYQAQCFFSPNPPLRTSLVYFTDILNTFVEKLDNRFVDCTRMWLDCGLEKHYG